MQIAVVSDTHSDQLAELARVIAAYEVEHLFFLGDHSEDGQVLAAHLGITADVVRGNTDYDTAVPLELVVEYEGVRILLTHGHIYDVKRGILGLYYRAQEVNADMAFFGHSHRPYNEDQGVWLINPGSPTRGKDPNRPYGTWGLLQVHRGQRPRYTMQRFLP